MGRGTNWNVDLSKPHIPNSAACLLSFNIHLLHVAHFFMAGIYFIQKNVISAFLLGSVKFLLCLRSAFYSEVTYPVCSAFTPAMLPLFATCVVTICKPSPLVFCHCVVTCVCHLCLQCFATYVVTACKSFPLVFFTVCLDFVVPVFISMCPALLFPVFLFHPVFYVSVSLAWSTGMTVCFVSFILYCLKRICPALM